MAVSIHALFMPRATRLITSPFRAPLRISSFWALMCEAKEGP